MKAEELSTLLNRAVSVRSGLLSLRDKAASALDSNSLAEEEDVELCSDIENFPELLQHRVNQLIELCTINPKTFARPKGGVPSEEQYQAYAQSIVRELRRNIDEAEQVLNKAQAHLGEILSKVHPVSLPLPLFRIWKDCGKEQPEGMPTERPEGPGTEIPDWNKILKEEEDGMEFRLFHSLGGEKKKPPTMHIVIGDEKINIRVDGTYSYMVLYMTAISLLAEHKKCHKCTLRRCMEVNMVEHVERIRDGTRAQKKPDKASGYATRFTASTGKLTCAKVSTNVDTNKVN